ncbi:MAG TPA: TonB-dependent receptor [Vicinamibacterales bacterium]|nr:TonB-dependent receptor [Vicinamibacterales bacterium]
MRTSRAVSLLLLVLIPGAAASAAAGSTFDARIIDKNTGKPIPNATVTILGHPGERFTDATGRIVWTPAPPPPFEVLVILPGGRFMKPVLIERITQPGPMEIVVEGLLSESVTVAAGAAPSIETTPASGTTLLTSTDIRTRAPATLTQTLENVAGVSTVSEGQAAVPVVRGFASGRTLIMVDGARVTSERRAGPSATFLDPFVLESVEVSRGPGSVAYGSDAFGGVIAARTRRVAPGSPLAFRLVGSIGAGIPEARGGFEVAKGVERGSVLFQTRIRDFNDYRSPEGTILNSGASDMGFLIRGEHAAGPGTLSAGWQSDFGRDIERPRNNSTTVRFYYPEENSQRFTAGYEQLKTGWLERLSLTGFLGLSDVITDQDRFATPTTPRSIERADVSASDYQFRALGERSAGAAHLEFGLDLNGRVGLEAIEERIVYNDTGTSSTTESFVSVENARKDDAGAFVSILVPATTQVLLAGGVRVDWIGTRNRGGYFGNRYTSNTSGSGYGSVTVSLNRIGLSGQVARGFRDPLLSDRYFRGPTGRGFVTGNPDLEPETSLQYDAAVRYTGARWRGAFFFFHYRISDLIERYQTEPDFFFFRNRGRARVRGIELETQGDLGRGVTVELSAQLTRGIALDDDAYLDAIPATSLSVQLRKQLRTRGFAQLRMAAFDRDTRPGPTERVVPGYAVFDLSGGWKITEQLDLQLAGRNVFDKEYLLSQDTRTVTAPGASILATLVASF